MTVPIIAVMAATRQGVIGNSGRLPWHYPQELKHFQDVTRDQVIIMGRKTYDSMPEKLLLNRTAIVMSRNKNLTLKHAYVAHSLDQCLSYINSLDDCKKAFAIGGSQIIELFLSHNLISSFILTIIKKSYSGDTFIDLNPLKTWQKSILFDCDNYTVYELTKS